MKTRKINGITFEVTSMTREARYWNLYEAYKCPSAAKQAVWSAWKDWFDQAFPFGQYYDRSIGIASANCQKFTIVMTAGGKSEFYRFYITADHARVNITK